MRGSWSSFVTQAPRIWQDLRDEHQDTFTAGYQSVQRFVRELAESSPLPVRRMECEAGQEAQVDFGRGAPVIEGDGKRRTRGSSASCSVTAARHMPSRCSGRRLTILCVVWRTPSRTSVA